MRSQHVPIGLQLLVANVIKQTKAILFTTRKPAPLASTAPLLPSLPFDTGLLLLTLCDQLSFQKLCPQVFGVLVKLLRHCCMTTRTLQWKVSSSSDCPSRFIERRQTNTVATLFTSTTCASTRHSYINYPISASNVCQVGDNLTCSVPVLQGREGLWSCDYGCYTLSEHPPPCGYGLNV